MYHSIVRLSTIRDRGMPDVNNLCIENIWSLMNGKLLLEYLLFESPLFRFFFSTVCTISEVVKFHKESDIGVCGATLQHCDYYLVIVCICNSKW